MGWRGHHGSGFCSMERDLLTHTVNVPRYLGTILRPFETHIAACTSCYTPVDCTGSTRPAMQGSPPAMVTYVPNTLS